MTNTTYAVIREISDPSGLTVIIHVSTVEEVIGTNEGYINVVKNMLALAMPVGYTVAELENAISMEGFDV